MVQSLLGKIDHTEPCLTLHSRVRTPTFGSPAPSKDAMRRSRKIYQIARVSPEESYSGILIAVA